MRNISGDTSLLTRIADIERESRGEISLAARDLQTGRTVLYHADRMVMTASVIKLPILVHVALAVREGALCWEEPLTLTEAEKVGGSGVLNVLTEGLSLSLRDACTLMMVVSDNTATNMVIERVGVETINRRMRALGLPRTTLNRKAYTEDPPTLLATKYGLGVTTPNEILRLLTLLTDGTLDDSATSADILHILKKQQYRDGIPRFLPADWKYAGKTGAVNAVRNDVGIVTAPDGRCFALALFCQKLPVVLWTPENPGLLALAKLAELLVKSL
jgi:beta-lactamase class A